MIDPVTAIAAASKAYAMTKAMVEAGRSVEDTMTQLGTWYGHASDVLYADKKARSTNPFKKVVFSKSVEAEAAKAFAAKKKLQAQQKELLSMIGMVYGKDGLDEFRAMKRQIAAQRERDVYRQQELKETMLESFLVVVLAGLASVLIMFMFTNSTK
jgi:hypothetical protein